MSPANTLTAAPPTLPILFLYQAYGSQRTSIFGTVEHTGTYSQRVPKADVM
jgi:hypothetical protein